jgi:hypothetical protein
VRTNPYVARPSAAIERLRGATADPAVRRATVHADDVRSLLAYLAWLEADRERWRETAFRYMPGDD